jgi:putative NADH-flavin reductase
MNTMGLGESSVRRVIVIGGATALAMTALLFSQPFYSAMSNPKAASSADVSRPVANQEPVIEEVSFVPSPTLETNPKFFFGSGDGSNGYYGERPEPTRQ